MNTIKVVNIKCGGCANTITKALTKKGYKNVKASNETQEVSFDGDIEKARIILTKIGYPPANSKEAQSLLKKAKSYVSCAIGKNWTKK